MITIPSGIYPVGLPSLVEEVPLQGFLISSLVVTQEGWDHEMGAEVPPPGSRLIPALLTWGEAQDYIRSASVRYGRKLCLPTDAEWQAACRGKGGSYFSFGGDEALLGRYAWYRANTPKPRLPQPVGGKLPNPFGLYDMEGNVWEWVAEGVAKGGDINSHPRQCRAHFTKEVERAAIRLVVH